MLEFLLPRPTHQTCKRFTKLIYRIRKCKYSGMGMCFYIHAISFTVNICFGYRAWTDSFHCKQANVRTHEPHPLFMVRTYCNTHAVLTSALFTTAERMGAQGLITVACALCLLPALPPVSGAVSSYPSLPLLFAEGSHYDVGHQIVSP